MNYVASGYVKTGYVRQDSDTVSEYTFDKYGKFIYVSQLATTCDLADMWSRWADWMIVGDNAKIHPAMKYSGFDPIPSGFTGATFFVYNGWRVVIDPAVTAITGVLYSEDYDTGYWTYDAVPLPIYPITVSAVVNTVTTGSGLSAEEHAQLMSLINTDLTVTDGKIDTVKTDTEQILADIDAIPNVVEVDKVAIAREVWSTELPLVVGIAWADENSDAWVNENSEAWTSA